MSGSARSCLRSTSLGLVLLAFSLLPLPSSFCLTILYSASLNGNLDGCACRSHPRAGLVKRAAWLRSLEHRGQSVLVDAGDILDVGPDPDLSREILETYKELGYDAIAVGDQEFSDGIEALRAYRETQPLVAHNLILCSGSSCLYFSPEPLIVTKQNEKVGLIAVLDPEVFKLYPQELTKQLKLEPPAQSAAAFVQRLQAAGVQWIIVLYHGPQQEAERLAAQVPGIHLIIFGHEQKLVQPKRIGDTLLVSPGEEGNRLGILTLERDTRGRVRFAHRFQQFVYERNPDDPAVRQRIERYRKEKIIPELSGGS